MYSSINQEILELWKQYFVNRTDIPSPTFYKDTKKKNPILFIGINPSFSKNYMEQIYQHEQLKCFPIQLTNNLIFDWKNFHTDHINLIAEMDSLGKQIIIDGTKKVTRHKFFRKHQEILDYVVQKNSNNSLLDWEHIDLFQYRITNQNEFKSLIYNKKKLTEFALKQIKISQKLIEEIEPSLIICINALGANLLKEVYKDSLNFNDENGYHNLNLNNKEIPIFFSAMLTNGVLDNHSFERLKWHIKKALQDQKIT